MGHDPYFLAGGALTTSAVPLLPVSAPQQSPVPDPASGMAGITITRDRGHVLDFSYPMFSVVVFAFRDPASQEPPVGRR